MKWKVLEEKLSKSWFVKQRADRRTKHHKTCSWFYCNRTGEFSSRGEGKRSLKSQGSSKTGCSCPAFITTRTDGVTGEVVAEYCLQHVGHKREIAFNRISSEMRSRIAGKLAQGVSMNSIMDNIRDTQFGQLTRDHLSTRADETSNDNTTSTVKKKTVTMPAAYYTRWKKWKENRIIRCCALSVKDKTHLTTELKRTTSFRPPN